MEKFKRRFYDSHPKLPLDPDSDQLKIIRPIHTDMAHISVVALGAFFGTLCRYEIGAWMPTNRDEWPVATMLVNISGAFLLGLLLQTLLHRGNDEGGHRILRLALGTGFLGSFTTYSSLAVSIVVLARGGDIFTAAAYGIGSVALGIVACAIGIWVATKRHGARRESS